MNELYRVLGISKQAVNQYDKRQKLFDRQVVDLLIEVDGLRADHPGCGVEKMYNTLRPDFMGRDRFIELLMELGYRVKRPKNYHRTTIPAAYKYPNLIEGMAVKEKNTVWQSDITYYGLNGRFYYIVFIIDVYTRQIVGYAVSDNLRAEANRQALKMALKGHGAPKVHHSDRGSQYIEKVYTELLKENGVAISMGVQAQDNAYAERINGTIKNEYLKHWEIQSFQSLKRKVKQAVYHYNNGRIHDSLPKGQTPGQFGKSSDECQMVEEIFAQNRITPKESTFFWCDEIKENNLFCII